VTPTFLALDEVLAIHADQLHRYGGFDGVRDDEALNTALATPEARMNNRYVHEDLAAMAGAYLYHLARYKPFVDGNRRTGLVAALVFLALNGASLAADPDELADRVRAAAAGETDKTAVAGWVRERVGASGGEGAGEGG
jgi:death on curing protein